MEDGQTQTASAAPHQESLPPSSRGLRGLLFESDATLSLDVEHFYMYQETQIRNRLSLTGMLQDDEDGCRLRKAGWGLGVEGGEKEERFYLARHVLGRAQSFVSCLALRRLHLME